MNIRRLKTAWAKAVFVLAVPVGPAFWFPLLLGTVLLLNAGNTFAQEGAPVRVAGTPLNILVPGMDTSPLDVIGWPVYGPDLERLGAVESIYSDANGKIAGAIIALKPEKAVQAKSVSVPRRDFVVQIGKFAMSARAAVLLDLPAYEYASAKERGTVLPAGSLMTAAPPVVQPVPVAAAATPEFSGNALIGAPVRNLADEAIGSVSDLVMDDKGQLQAVMVSIANSPGRSARLESHEVRVVREEGGVTVLTGLARGTITNRDVLQQAAIR